MPSNAQSSQQTSNLSHARDSRWSPIGRRGRQYDAIVVGARCAGTASAMLLARRGFEVLLVDRARLPSEIPHGHYIRRHGPQRLAEWGLLERVLATGCPPITSMTIDLGDFPLTGYDLSVDDVPIGLGPRRSALDAVLLDAAIGAGVEFRPAFPVAELTTDGDRVTGVRGPGGVVERGRVVIGADGRNSTIAKQVRAPAYAEQPTLTCWYFSYWSGVPGDGLEIIGTDRRLIFAFPTNDDLFAIFVAWPIDELPAVRSNVERELMSVIDRVPRLSERVRAGRRAERFYGATQLPNFLRRPHGPGWALVGDAGCHKDPARALGICDALRDAELLADCVSDALAGVSSEADALTDYERRRNDATLEEYHDNIRTARLTAPPPELIERRAAIRGDAGATSQFCLAWEGHLPQQPAQAAA
jgi:flavin-dependent dehydrogenase